MRLIKCFLSASAVTIITALSVICAHGQDCETAQTTTAASDAAATTVTSCTVTETVSETTAPTMLSQTTTSSTAITTVVSLEEGWNKTDGKWFYFDGEKLLTGKQEVDGEYYIFASNGALRTGWQTVNSVRRFYDKETHSPVCGWIEYLGNKYYCDSLSGKLSGMHEIDGNTYIFSQEGIMHTDTFVTDGKLMYYCSDDGTVLYGDNRKTPVLIGDTYYIISPKGNVLRGWHTVNGIRVYYDYETGKPLWEWIDYLGNKYYTDAEKGKYTGEQMINNHSYVFDENGIMQTGFQRLNNGKTCYYYEDCTWAKGFASIEKSTYYFDDNGYMATGWKTINNQKYFFAKNGKMTVGFADIYGNRYYFNSKGVMQTGFVKIGTNTYYFSSNGNMLYNWQTVNKNKYYFGSDGIMKTGFFKIDKNTYYFGTDGAMQTGLKIINGKYYNFGDSGILTPIKVFVGVGHGGYDPGAIGYIVEKEYTLKTAKIVEEHLKAAGIEYMLSRDADIDTTMESKLKLCNDYDPDLIIDIHFNAVGGHGFEVYHSKNGGMSQTLAENINAEVSKLMYSSGCKIFLNANGLDRFTIIRETHAPAVLLEGGFVDDWEDSQFIKANYAKLAKAYAVGVLKTIAMMFGST
ncbi:MAG: N-acetylmuramoyl-L-alanine amidase [Ruminococcus sp.]|nr:N-acetylmuramoyl-L-alanine amidase [Ruminococcus sp.]